MSLSINFEKMCEIYKLFARGGRFSNPLDFSDKAKEEMYQYETFGKGDLKQGIFPKEGIFNGYAIGKHNMDVTLAMWIEDIEKGLLLKGELYQEYPKWWLDKVIGHIEQGTHALYAINH